MEYRQEVADYYAREKLISTLRNRFKTYGFYQVNTPSFESYDLYTTVKGTIPKDEMLKIISPNGKVLVLRPDVTIPVTQLYASSDKEQLAESRYSYITDVYRSSFETNYDFVKMQAGVEVFGSTSAETEMEIISLAIDCLNDLGYEGFKIQLGHAGVVTEILDILSLPPEKEQQFKQLIHSKNIAGLEIFLKKLAIAPEIKKRITAIPFLYGKAQDVLQKALSLSLSEDMTGKLKRLLLVTEMLEIYGFQDEVVIDLGLINHMNYYSGLIFQGFITEIGKPILLGGRYDHLAEQFTNSTPAVGFAFDLESLVESSPLSARIPEPILLEYDDTSQTQALILSKQLRDLNYPVTMNHSVLPITSYTISMNDTGNIFTDKGNRYSFSGLDDLLPLLQRFVKL